MSALEGIGATNRPCEEDLLFNEAVRTPGPPGAEDDVMMDESVSGPPVDLEEARGYLDEDDALQVRLRIMSIIGTQNLKNSCI